MASPEQQSGRRARIERATSESSITVDIDLDGTGATDIDTGVPFFDHMLTSFGKHGCFDLTVKATGDIDIEAHHTVEDTAIVLGQAVRKALGDKAGIRRFAEAKIPMDETLTEAIVDVSGRPYFVFRGEPESMITYSVIGAGSAPYGTVLNQHVFESFASNAQIALHVIVHYGRDPHHITEAEYKAVARALRAACEPDPRVSGIPSTKGTL